MAHEPSEDCPTASGVQTARHVELEVPGPLPVAILYESILRSAMDGHLVLASDGKVVETNEAYCRMSGYSRDELLGKHISELEAVETCAETASRSDGVRAKGAVRFESQHRRKDGTVFDVEVSAQFRQDFGGCFVGFVRDITERKKAVEALRDQRDFLESLIDTAQTIVLVLDTEGRIVRFNPYFEQVSGYRLEEMKGRDWFSTCLPGSDQQHVREVFSKAIGDTQTKGNINPILTKSGMQRMIEWHDKTLKDAQGRVIGLLSTGRDITEQKTAEQMLTAANERYRTVFEGAAEGIVVADFATMRFKYANPAACRMLGYSESELRTLTVMDIHPPETAAGVAATVEAGLLSEHVVVPSLPCVRKDGTRFFVDVVGSALVIDQRRCAVAFFTDASWRLQAEEERKQLAAKAERVQRLESLGVLAGGIAHDFNNLLQVVLGNVESAIQDVDRVSPLLPRLCDSRRATLRAAHLCRQLLAYAGKGHLALARTDLSRAVDETLHAMALSTGVSGNVRLVHSLRESLPAVECDRSYIQQMLVSLVSNATEAIGDADGTVSISTGSLVCDREYLRASAGGVDEPAPGEYVYVEVLDTGCGMNAETQARMFEPFFTTKFVGRGLGLSAVLGTVRSHHGVVRVESQPGLGTRVRVLLPVAAGPAEVQSPKSVARPACAEMGAVLLVDDDDMVRNTVGRFLSRIGYSVLSASSGFEAVKLARQSTTQIQCVLLDLGMPEMDGVATFVELQKINPTVPVIVSSGYAEDECLHRFEGLKIAGYIQKPYGMELLRTTMAGVLGESLAGTHAWTARSAAPAGSVEAQERSARGE